MAKQKPVIRTFASGATRDVVDGKFDYDGFLSPHLIEAFGTYMHFNRHLPDGSTRPGDNWQHGFDEGVARSSLWRHFNDFWRATRPTEPGGHEYYPIKENVLWAAMGVIFNTQAMVHVLMKDDPDLLSKCLADMEAKRAERWQKPERSHRS